MSRLVSSSSLNKTSFCCCFRKKKVTPYHHLVAFPCISPGRRDSCFHCQTSYSQVKHNYKIFVLSEMQTGLQATSVSTKHLRGSEAISNKSLIRFQAIPVRSALIQDSSYCRHKRVTDHSYDWKRSGGFLQLHFSCSSSLFFWPIFLNFMSAGKSCTSCELGSGGSLHGALGHPFSLLGACVVHQTGHIC